MKIHITKDGQQHGPYSESEIQGYLNSGQFVPSDLACGEGSAVWVPLSQLITMPDSSPPLPVTLPSQTSSSGSFSDSEIIEIAKKQKIILWLILASFVAAFIPYAPIVTGILSLIFIYQLAISVRSTVAWLYAVLALIPLVGLIALLVVNSKATKALKGRGVRVGLMGANQSDLKNLSAQRV